MFDPYRKWLGIPQWEQPANHYRLLGITPFENDPDVIDAAADRQMAHVRNYQSGPHSELSQKILNELSAARVCLLSPEKKKAYDDQFRLELAQKAGHVQMAGPPFGFFVKGAAKYFWVQARRIWNAQCVLPSAYLALGRDVHALGRYRERLADFHAKLDRVTEDLAAIEQPAASSKPAAQRGPADPPAGEKGEKTTPGQQETTQPQHPEGTPPDASTGKAGGLWGRMTSAVRVALLARRRKALLRQLARAAYQIDGPACGPPGLAEPVRQAMARSEEFRHEITLLSEVPPNTWLSPKRLAWIVLGILTVLVLLFLWARAMLSPG